MNKYLSKSGAFPVFIHHRMGKVFKKFSTLHISCFSVSGLVSDLICYCFNLSSNLIYFESIKPTIYKIWKLTVQFAVIKKTKLMHFRI